MKKTQQVLVIEDDPTSRLHVVKTLERAGYLVAEGSDLGTGMSLAIQHTPHIVILDLLMLGGSGYDFLERRKLLPQLSQIPILVLSGLTDRDAIHKAVFLGADDYALKPANPALLLQKIRNLLFHRKFPPKVFDSTDRPSVNALFPGRLLKANEVEIVIETPIRIAPGSQVKVRSETLEKLSYSDCVFRKTKIQAEIGPTGQYSNEIAALGLSENGIKLIRELKKKRK